MTFVNRISKHHLGLIAQTQEQLQFTHFPMNRDAEAVFWVNSDAKFLDVNDISCWLVGYSREELLSMTMQDVKPDFSFKTWLEYWNSIKHKGAITFESIYRTKQGQSFLVEVKFTYLELYGKEYGCILVRNITKRKQLEVCLHQANETLEAEKKLNEQRAHLAYMVSHEFRNPLNLISFSTSLLKRHSGKWTEEKKLSYLDRIQITVEKLNQLLDSVLIIDKSEAGKLEFKPKPLNLCVFCDDLVAEMQLGNNNQRIITVSKGNCSTVCLDAKLLHPILTNLLSNAIKYSPESSKVNLEVSDREGKVIFQIKDAGIGIPATDQQRLFEPFHRGRNVRDIPGSGLGLTVVKKLVDIHGGQIFVNSEVGVGTTFTVMLPSSQPI